MPLTEPKSDQAWWHEFNIYQKSLNRKQVIALEPAKYPQKTYLNPILEAKRYDQLLKTDPTIHSIAGVARALELKRCTISKALSLLRLSSPVKNRLAKQQDPETLRYLNETHLRFLLKLPNPNRQLTAFNKLLKTAAHSSRKGPAFCR